MLTLVTAGAGAGAADSAGGGTAPFAVVMSAATSGGHERLIVAAIVRGEGVGSLDLIREDGVFYLPVTGFAEVTGARAVATADGVRLETSLGDVEISSGQLRTFDEALYLSEQVLEERLVTRLRFDLEEFAVRLDVPWRPLMEDEEAPLEPEVEPDVNAPSASLSRLRVDLQSTAVGTDSITSGTAALAGRVGGGRWSVRSRAAEGADPVVEDYAWIRDFERALVQVGHQRIALSGLMPGLSLTGAQAAWTNRDPGEFLRFANPGLLLRETRASGVTVQGSGPAAGLAQLRVDGAVVDSRVIGLDGRYEFPDVVLPGGRLAQVEVYLYDRSNLSVPVRIEDASQSTWDRLLDGGAVVHQGGLGLSGNLLDDANPAEDELAGFFQSRVGVSDRLTVEAAVQHDQDATVATGGVVTRLGRSLLTSLTLGASGEAMGYQAVVENVRLPWRFLGQSRWREAGFSSPDSEERSDHWIELGYQPSATFDLALYGRIRDQDGESTEYLLPGVNWYPLRQLNLRARPDADGDYRFDAFVYLGDSLRGAVSRTGGDTGASLQYSLGDRIHQIRVTADFIDGLGDRYTALVARNRISRWAPTWEAGVTYREQDAGLVARATVPVMPGVLVGADYQDDTAFGRGGDARITVRVTMDLSYSQGRFLAADSLPSRSDVGSLTGRIRVDAPDSYHRPDLAGVLIEVDRRPSTRTESDGSFFLGDLSPGIYRVRLDPGALPIELVPARTSYVAEVAAGAATRVDFVVRPLFGIAGRVTRTGGTRVPGVRVEVVDAQGQVVGRGVTDRFGLYRVDGLAVGRYAVRVAPAGSGSPAGDGPRREFELVDDFLFGQDLVIGAGGAGQSE